MYFYTGLLALLFLQTTQSASTTTPEEAAESVEFTDRSEYTRCNPAYADRNGVVEIGCWGYKKCVHGYLLTHYCSSGYVFDRATFRCVRIGYGSTACGTYVSCRGRPTGIYPDIRGGCATFYWCVFGRFVGRQYCPDDLVFDETIKVCNYRRDVAPPCGTKTIRG